MRNYQIHILNWIERSTWKMAVLKVFFTKKLFALQNNQQISYTRVRFNGNFCELEGRRRRRRRHKCKLNDDVKLSSIPLSCHYKVMRQRNDDKLKMYTNRNTNKKNETNTWMRFPCECYARVSEWVSVFV